jgi:transcriptional regulator with XRE-family HTH domain
MVTLRLTPAQRAEAGRRMRAARELAGLSLTKVADDAGVSITAVVQWEHGATPAPELRAALAELYQLDEDQLFAEVAERMAANRALLGLT